MNEKTTGKSTYPKEVGTEICPIFFQKAENYARRKLDLINERAGRKYGEDGYGDEYLVLLTADTVREMAFSEYTLFKEIYSGKQRRLGLLG